VRHRGSQASDRSNLELSEENSFAWSQGLGLELSPIKTRSAQKRAGPSPFIASSSNFSTGDLGALRGLKSLARVKR
jgi:hypothetical protein